MDDDQANAHTLPVEPDQWQIECENAAFLATSLLRLARRSCDSAVVVELLRGIPNSRSDISGHEESGLFWRLIEEASHARHSDPTLYQAFRDSLVRFMDLDPAKRAMIEASVIGTILGGGMG